MAAPDKWRGGWDERIYGYVRRLGYENATDFAESRPSATFAELSSNLDEDVPPLQLQLLLREEASRSKKVKEFAIAALVRCLREFVPKGWAVGAKWEFGRARAFARWYAILGDEYKTAAEEARARFDSAHVPEGWLPAGPDDTLLVDVFDGIDFQRSERHKEVRVQHPVMFQDLLGDEELDTAAYWIGIGNLREVKELDVEVVNTAFTEQYDFEEQADRHGRVFSSGSSVMNSFVPLAPVQLVDHWSPLPVAWSKLGRPTFVVNKRFDDGRLFVLAAWSEVSDQAPKLQQDCSIDESRFRVLLCAAIAEARAQNKAVVMMTKPGWSYENHHEFSLQTRNMMRKAGFVVTDRVERRH